MLTPVNEAVVMLHVVRDADGEVSTASNSGFACTLLDADQSDQSALATWSEPCDTGYLDITVTPDAVGVWVLRVTNPDTADGLTSEYQLQVVASATDIPGGDVLVSLTRVKQWLQISDSDTSDDDFLNAAIAAATEMITARLGSSILSSTTQEYVDGSGGKWLDLRHRIQASETVTVYESDWSSGSAVNTLLGASNYIVWRADEASNRLPGRIYRQGGSWTRGVKNYMVDYSAGWASIPADIQRLAAAVVIALKNRRKDVGTVARDVGSGGMSFNDLAEIESLIDRGLEPYRDWR